MARGRMLSTDVSVDPEAQSLTLASYALYLSTIPHLDRDGLIDAHPLKLVAMAAPLRYEFRDNAPALINEWVESGLVVRYQVSSRQSVIFFKGFRRHQQGMEYSREPVSRFPPPPGWTRTKEGLVPDDPELCFRLAESFHPRSEYRKTLLTAAGADVPEEAPKPSRGVREPSRSHREEFAPKSTENKSNEHGVGDDHSLNTSHHVGYSNTPHYAKLSAAFAETPDDELRIGIDALAASYGLPDSFNGWPRALAGWHRDELLLVLATLKTWEAWDERQFDRINNLSGFLRAAVKSATWPKLDRNQIASLVDDVADAVSLAALPAAEAMAEFAARQEERHLASRYNLEES